MAMQIAMEGREAANAWKGEAQDLNEKTERLLKEVAELLKSVKEFSQGTLVDEIYEFGTQVITATTKLMEGMNQIFKVVEGLLNFLQELFSGAKANTDSAMQTIM